MHATSMCVVLRAASGDGIVFAPVGRAAVLCDRRCSERSACGAVQGFHFKMAMIHPSSSSLLIIPQLGKLVVAV